MDCSQVSELCILITAQENPVNDRHVVQVESS